MFILKTKSANTFWNVIESKWEPKVVILTQNNIHMNGKQDHMEISTC